MDNFKKCSKCGEVKLLDCFSKNKTRKDGFEYVCKICRKSDKAIYQVVSKEKIKIRKAKWRDENTEKANAIMRAWYAANQEKVKARNARYAKELTDSYIKNEIKKQTGVPNERITKDLIETKRLHILIKRKLKDLTK